MRPDLSLPLTFAKNRGQKDSSVRYYAQGVGYAFYLTRDTIVLSTTLRFSGANPRVGIEGGERAAGAINYFYGNDPARWHTDVPHYSQVVYRDLWPGIDLQLQQRYTSLKTSPTSARRIAGSNPPWVPGGARPLARR